jgi:hypothetical protein
VGEDFQAELSALAPIVMAAYKGFEATFEHRDDCFNLNPVAIGV